MILEYINFKNNIMNFTKIKRLGNTYYHTSTFKEVKSTLKDINLTLMTDIILQNF